MSDNNLSLNPIDILAIISRQAQEVANHTANPPADFNPDALVNFIVRMYGFAQRLQMPKLEEQPDAGIAAQAPVNATNGADARAN